MEDKMELVDRWLICVECEREFVFEIGEQKYFQLNALQIPKRCPLCRIKRRIAFTEGKYDRS